MTEQELRESVRRQILQNFHENKDALLRKNEKRSTISLNELRSIVRSELVKRLKEGEDKNSSDTETAAEELDSLDSTMKGLIQSTLQSGEKKKDESLTAMAAGLAIGLPGLLELMSKMAKLLAKGLNKVTKSNKFDPEKEGKTFEHAAHNLHHKYIGWLKPVVKVAFKKQIAGDDKKAEIYAQVVYAVLLATIATHALVGAGTGLMHGAKELGQVFHTAYEAAHGTHAGVETVQIGSALRAAFAAVGEKAAAQEIASALS
jgi:hypothetical protein